MPRNLARYEQLLRIHTVFSVLVESRHPADDETLIADVKERLGLSQFSSRTLHRDCDFLVNCGYPVEHVPIPGTRRLAWRINASLMAGRRIPAAPLTVLELLAFGIARELFGGFTGTVLWTGIEALRSKLEQKLPTEFLTKVADARRVFHVRRPGRGRSADRPRMIAALSGAIADHREIEIQVSTVGGIGYTNRTLRPAILVVDLKQVQLAAWQARPGTTPKTGPAADRTPLAEDPLELIDLDRIKTVTRLDSRFDPLPIDLSTLEHMADDAA